VDQYPHLRGWRSTLALLYAELGDLTKARAEFEQLAGGDWTDLPRDSAWLLTTCRAADTCFRLGDRDAAAVLYEQLLPFADRNVVLGRVASIAIGSASRHLGQLATVLGRLDEAADHFEAALRINRGTGARPWLALSECDYAALLRGRGDDERAGELVRHARDSGLGIVEMHAGG
jgi:tetratricopeptide (TPR) repeat protein